MFGLKTSQEITTFIYFPHNIYSKILIYFKLPVKVMLTVALKHNIINVVHPTIEILQR